MPKLADRNPSTVASFFEETFGIVFFPWPAPASNGTPEKNNAAIKKNKTQRPRIGNFFTLAPFNPEGFRRNDEYRGDFAKGNPDTCTK